MAAPTTGLTVIKRMTYRGANEEWSNHYWLSGSTPADSAAWRTLFDALVAQEKTVYRDNSSVVRGYGYNSVSPTASAVWSVDLTVSPNTPVQGTMTATGNFTAGDQAAWVRWKLDKLNSRGKPVYLRKYFHDLYMVPTAPDQVASGVITAYNAFGTKMFDGTFAGSRVITDTSGTAVLSRGSSTYITTRTLKRRGKRPGS